MSKIIEYAINHARLTVAVLLFVLTAGFVAYATIPKEAEPDVKIPIIYVQLTQRGISPEDAERLLLRPVETQLKSVSNVKEMRSTAYEGGGYVLLEFEAGFDSKSALADVRAKVDDAKHDLPKDVDEPSVQEVNLSLYPVLVVALRDADKDVREGSGWALAEIDPVLPQNTLKDAEAQVENLQAQKRSSAFARLARPRICRMSSCSLLRRRLSKGASVPRSAIEIASTVNGMWAEKRTTSRIWPISLA